STLLPLGVRVTILLAWYCAGSGLQWGVGEASQHHALTPCVASACGSAMYTALSVSHLVPHAKDKIVASWSGRCFDSSWRFATCAHSTRVLELDVQKSRRALHSDPGVLISEAQWGRFAGAEESVPRPAGGCLHEVFSGPLCNGTQAYLLRPS
ncbi:trans-sialidase, partial [Trypanosoma cruzi]